MKRTVKKQFWFSPTEAEDLRNKARKTCLTEAALVRLLVRGYEPKERPDERFFTVMQELTTLSERIQSLFVKGVSDPSLLLAEINRWNSFQLRVEREFLSPEKQNEKWQ